MKKSQWKIWAALAVVAVLLVVKSLNDAANLRAFGAPPTGADLMAVGWFVFLIRNGQRAIRGFLAEGAHRQFSQRVRFDRDQTGETSMAFRYDLAGQRIDTLLLSLAAALIAIGGAQGHDSAGDMMAWGFGAFSWVALLTCLRTIKFSSHFVLSARGIDCRFVLPSLIVGWDEIASVRSTGTPGTTGRVLVTITDAALARLDERSRKRMLRLKAKRGAHYRWADLHYESSAAEVASVVEFCRVTPEARALIAQGVIPVPAGSMPVPVATSGAWAAPTVQAAASSVSPVSTKALDHPRSDVIEARRLRAGQLALVGGLLRVAGYFLPWASATGVRTVYLNGSKFGAPLLSIGFSLAIVGIAIAYLAGRRETSPGLLVGAGAGAVFASIVNAQMMFDVVHKTQAILTSRGESITVAPSMGPWVQLLGAVIIVAGGVWASRLARVRDDDTADAYGTTWVRAQPAAQVPSVASAPGPVDPSPER